MSNFRAINDNSRLASSSRRNRTSSLYGLLFQKSLSVYPAANGGRGDKHIVKWKQNDWLECDLKIVIIIFYVFF